MVNIGDKSITITIEVDSSGAVKAVNGLEQDLGTLKRTAETSSGGFSTLQASIVTLNQGFQLARGAISGAVQAFQTLGVALEEAGKIEGVTAGFESVQAAAGQLAGDALGKLQTATRGLVSDFDLMQKATQAAQLGLDPKTYDQVAGAAVRLGNALGVDANLAIESVTTGIGRQSVQMLDNLGIIVKANDAYESFAAANKKTASDLTETEKRIAFQTAALEALRKKASEVNEVQETAATAFQRVTVALENARAKVVTGISSNQRLATSLNEIAETIEKIDLTPVIDALSLFIEKGTNIANKVLPIITRETTYFINGLNVLGKTLENFATTGSLFISTQAAIQQVNDELSAAQSNAAAARGALLGATYGEVPRAIENTGDKLGELGDKAGKAGEKAEEAFKRLGQAIDDTLEIDRLPELTKQIEQAFSGNARANAEELAKSLLSIGKNAQDAGIELSEVAKRVKEINDLPIFGPGNEAGERAFGFEMDKIAEDLAKASEEIAASLQGAIENALASGIRNLADALISGNSDDVRGAFSQLGGDVAGAYGASIGGPIGQAIGSTVGELAVDGLFSAFDSIFGGTNAGEEARQTVDRFIADALDASRLRLVIDGELRELTDLTFAGNFTGGLFDNLVPEAQAAFQGVGIALESLLGVSEEIGGQVGTVLANNVGGNLNNLQILVGELGIGFEEMGEAVEQAFLRGEIAGGEAFAALQQIQKISEKGIPDALGATRQAFDNLIESGENGRLILDAIGDLGVEAIEKGIQSLAGLRADLEASGQFSQTQIDQLFNALSFAGVTSLEQLEEAGVQTAIKVAARLADIGFEFQNVGSDLGELVTGLNTLPDRKDIELNVRTNFDRNTQEAIDSGIFNQQFPGRAAIS